MQLKSKPLNHLLFLVFVSLIASSTFAGIKIASEFFNAYEITFWRSFIAFMFCLPFLFARKSWVGLDRNSWLFVFLISFVGVLLPFTLLNWAGERIDSSLVGILWSTLPIFGIVLAHFLTKMIALEQILLPGVWLNDFGEAVPRQLGAMTSRLFIGIASKGSRRPLL
jgi:drug/metabolite transporter (DMT)-like permease